MKPHCSEPRATSVSRNPSATLCIHSSAQYAAWRWQHCPYSISHFVRPSFYFVRRRKHALSQGQKSHLLRPIAWDSLSFLGNSDTFQSTSPMKPYHTRSSQAGPSSSTIEGSRPTRAWLFSSFYPPFSVATVVAVLRSASRKLTERKYFRRWPPRLRWTPGDKPQNLRISVRNLVRLRKIQNRVRLTPHSWPTVGIRHGKLVDIP